MKCTTNIFYEIKLIEYYGIHIKNYYLLFLLKHMRLELKLILTNDS